MDWVPWLIAAYVVFGLISAIVRLVRQGAKAMQQAQAAAPTPGMTADDVRAALARRRQAAASAAAAGAAKAAPRIVAQPAPVPLAPMPEIDRAPSFAVLDTLPAGSPGLLTGIPAHLTGPGTISAVLLSLPPAAAAVVASAIVGPCSAHRGAGHQPEDW